MKFILLFFAIHWFSSLFFQTFFLHRYASHKMFTMSSFWEKFFYLMTFITQGASFLNPRAYAIMHRMHHAYSDTEKDPHSPHFIKDVWGLMMKTKGIYLQYAKYKTEPEPEFRDRYPTWAFMDKVSDLWSVRILFGVGYFMIYYFFAPSLWWYLLLPAHLFMGPLHGAIVNWCGHKYGYANYDNDDHSKNTIPLDLLMLGELFQNNHHKSPNRANFAKKWFEFDPTYPAMVVMNYLGIIHFRRT